MRIGLDIGSTTIKAVALDAQDHIVYCRYARHFGKIAEMAAEMLNGIAAIAIPGDTALCVSGSAGMGLAETLRFPFVQEVYATRLSIDRLVPETDVAVELGGEDAKILFLRDDMGRDDLEVRMNGSCAGGTGAFIDQMATLMNVTPDELNELSKNHEKIYSIASRCGVFAKSDIQPLINQGAKREDVAKSIFVAVVNQSVAGLAQGRVIAGRVLYLGGPMTFLSELRQSFDEVLSIRGLCPEDSLYYVAYGAALSATEQVDLAQAAGACGSFGGGGYQNCPPLFADEAAYRAFRARHERADVPRADPAEYAGGIAIGIDAGSTTVKAVAIDEHDRILLDAYQPNGGNPVTLVRAFLERVYEACPRAYIASAASTGYGEDMIRHAFRLDGHIVETIAHFTAAKKFRPDVDFIIDIGGQDIKCFKIVDGVIDDIFLNEACSSGCGSFLQTFANAWGMDIRQFAKIGLFAEKPVDLGSRCTVFMNSSVKQAQKDGATIENISAGLSISVVKNALYKVIRTADPDRLGRNIVVQGGSFLNDAVLRAFELEIGRDVIRPGIAGLMGAYGAAVYSRRFASGKSGVLTREELKQFHQSVKNVPCNGCPNHCQLTVNQFDGARRFISGNKCLKPLGVKADAGLNLLREKREWLAEYASADGKRGRIGIPFGLNMYELLPFWHTILTELGFAVVVSPESTRALYQTGQSTIPSDTVCYPAKLMHGHIDWLLREGVDAILYPCMTYNFDEHKGDNYYNCPVVAYYPEVIRANVAGVKQVAFLCDYFGLHRKREFARHLHAALIRAFPDVGMREVARAVEKGYQAYETYMGKVRARGLMLIREAEEAQKPLVVLAGRPYHADREVSHLIDQLITELGAVVVTEDSVAPLAQRFDTNVLNQWTYHARLYSAAKWVAENPNRNICLVQLVSFGCGVDAITTDEVREILGANNRIYTQIKIDEIANLGAVRIRLRSLFAAMGWGEAQ